MTETQKNELSTTQYGSETERWYKFMRLLVHALAGVTIEVIKLQFKPCKCRSQPRGKQWRT
jgi:hypothetical protein